MSEASIDKAAAAISTYERYHKGKDFRVFHSERARSFKRHLSNKLNERTGAKLTAASANGVLREVKAFFLWLADQSGYKSKVTHSDADYLSPDRKSEAARRSSCWKPHPSPDQVRHLLQSMPTETTLHRRNRALIVFLFLTCSREGAAISLRIVHIDLANAYVHFDGKNVNTKFGKSYMTAFFPIGEDVERIVRSWISELKTKHLFSESDGAFNRSSQHLG
ncbi:MAG: hypothetical protein COB40_13545 [Marinosulfonomonas sp.]|nr:MAG: hypothetical protein COB40_13545 [Marinosulfonomonas sp.]